MHSLCCPRATQFQNFLPKAIKQSIKKNTKMEKCCINGCDSHKHIGEMNIGYFPFPTGDEIMMKKWLAQINLPNWKPEAHHRICSMHFCTDDVNSNPNRKQPFLNPISVPTIFPGKAAGNTSPNSIDIPTISMDTAFVQPLPTVKINGNRGCDMSVSQSMPVFLIPVQGNVQHTMHISAQYTAQVSMQQHSDIKNSAQIIVQDSQELQQFPNPVPAHTEESSRRSVQQRPILQPRLRKILPKPDFLIIPNVEGMPAVPNIVRSVSLQQPDCFVPNVVNSAPNGSAITRPSNYPGNKRAVLQISVNKHHNKDEWKESSCTFNEKAMDISSEETNEDESMKRPNLSEKEITIENTSTNRAVTFRLDPKSGEIIVTTQRIDDSLKDEEDEETTRTERKVDYACEQPSAAKLRHLYTKSQRECKALRKRLRLLRRRHREEQEEIEKLQEHLTQVGDEVEKTCREAASESLGTRQKEPNNSVHSSNDDDYENVLHEVKKMKRDIRITRRGRLTISNGQLEAQQLVPRPTDHNRHTELLEGTNDPPRITQSTDSKILGEINDQCKDASRTINPKSIDLDPNSGSDVTVYREEFLNVEFLFE